MIDYDHIPSPPDRPTSSPGPTRRVVLGPGTTTVHYLPLQAGALVEVLNESGQCVVVTVKDAARAERSEADLDRVRSERDVALGLRDGFAAEFLRIWAECHRHIAERDRLADVVAEQAETIERMRDDRPGDDRG